MAAHLAHLADLAGGPGDAAARLDAVLLAYARICHHRSHAGSEELGVLLHRGEAVDAARRRLHRVFRGLLDEAASAGEVRDDVPAGELAHYCLHALGAAGALRGEAAVRRLVAVTRVSLAPEVSAVSPR